VSLFGLSCNKQAREAKTTPKKIGRGKTVLHACIYFWGLLWSFIVTEKFFGI
jgi:hypothetical protein